MFVSCLGKKVNFPYPSNNKIIQGQAESSANENQTRMYCEMRTLEGFTRYKTDWIKQMKHLTSLVHYLKGEKKPVNSKGKCHQMSELELLQNKAECFPRDKNCCTKLLELYKSNS